MHIPVYMLQNRKGPGEVRQLIAAARAEFTGGGGCEGGAEGRHGLRGSVRQAGEGGEAACECGPRQWLDVPQSDDAEEAACTDSPKPFQRRAREAAGGICVVGRGQRRTRARYAEAKLKTDSVACFV